ncbi:glycosyltransferase family 39 protein [Hyphomicrobium sp.]|uniref:ArnT family glycosyltransferase n=1 Tax=Hyphomicrobium sp. TaxID=82 RepID=UPI0025C1F987|nr:glycosyltransferase family 39 protein [Hyphomicrobium sp.]MCC7250485.1 glycosyltransferase family 39 protein [Hyphomicrobium sp.]
MTSGNSTANRWDFATVLLLGGLLVTASALLPAFPVDETRYLTVAWEMRITGNWSLPTLNFEPYSHKPPLLFWLINASWSVLGVAVWPARLVGAAATVLVLILTHRLERLLAPAQSSGPALSVLMLLGLPLFLVLGCSIMFDMLLTMTVSGALLALWIAGRSGDWRAFLAYGASIGLGLLAKGPVVLLFTVPAALLAPCWIAPEHRRHWYLRIAAAIALGALMGLAWALRAASIGGAEYAEMLLWTQSAGRIASSFAHARPFWFYVPVLLLFCVPLLVWRPAWTSLRRSIKTATPGRNFLLSWFLPGLFGLSLISGKQIHYLLPVLPAVALLVSLSLHHVELRNADRFGWAVLAAGILLVLAVLAMVGRHLYTDDSALASIATQLSLPGVLVTGALAVGAIACFRGSAQRMLVGLAAANSILLGSLTLQSRNGVAGLFDLQPLANVMQRLRDRPIAVAQRTRGEFGFLARLNHPVDHVPETELPSWFLRHPDGIAVIRCRSNAHNCDAPFPGRVLYRKEYRLQEIISIVSASMN